MTGHYGTGYSIIKKFIRLSYFGIFTLLFLALEIKAGHPQISYYLFLLLLVFGIVEFIDTVKTKKYMPFVRSTAIVVIAGLIAVLTNITSLWATYEYGKYTIRGKSELTTNQENKTSGLDKDYATQWSYGVGETWSLLIPNANGGSSRPIGLNESALSDVEPQYKEYVANASQYFGNQPFTSGPVYIRLPRLTTPVIFDENYKFAFGKAIAVSCFVIFFLALPDFLRFLNFYLKPFLIAPSVLIVLLKNFPCALMFFRNLHFY